MPMPMPFQAGPQIITGPITKKTFPGEDASQNEVCNDKVATILGCFMTIFLC